MTGILIIGVLALVVGALRIVFGRILHRANRESAPMCADRPGDERVRRQL